MVLWHEQRPLRASTARQWTRGRSCPTALSLHKWPLYAWAKAEQWASSAAVPANYVALLLLPGSPSPAGRVVLRASDVRWPGSTSQRGWYLVDPSGPHLVHQTQTSAGALVGPWQTSELSGQRKARDVSPGEGKMGVGFLGE